MQIAAISSITPIGQATPSLAKPSAASRTTQASTSAAPKTATTAHAPAAQPSSAPASAGKSSAHAGAAASQSSSASAAEQTLAAVYSTTVGGKSYSGSVEETNGEYTATIANLPGASASGSSIASAENNLGTVIDTLA
jgi:hypothetical protein